MIPFKSQFLRDAKDRGFIHQCTNLDKLDILLSTQTTSAYIGFDCTAPSLHAGSLVSIMLLRLFQQCGHKPIVLMGGGTTKIGDPSGKEETRKLIDDHTIQVNMDGIKKIFSKYLLFGDGPTDAVMINNADWLNDISYIPFLRDYGRHFSINRMLSFDSVKLRLAREQNLSFLEFNYMIVQAYDFLELFRRHNCKLQMGGSDQWGNIVNGTDLTRKTDSKEVFGLTTPLLTTSSGTKMGKTAKGAVWLNEDLLPPYHYWQYWRNTEDADVFRFFRLFTDFSIDQIDSLQKETNTNINELKKTLATEISKLCHGSLAANSALKTAEATFESGVFGSDLPKITIDKVRFNKGIPAFQLFYEAGLTESGGEARRLIKNGGGKINNQIIFHETEKITEANANEKGLIKLSAGKKRHLIIQIK